MSIHIDINADLGELADTSLDEQIMRYVSSCNIASGGHAGNTDSIMHTIQLAKKYQVKIGAHPSFPDRKNFGRKVLAMSDDDLITSLTKQIATIRKAAEQQHATLHHIKPHGALYNLMASDSKVAHNVIKAIKKIDNRLLLYGLAHSATEHAAKEQNLPFVREAFADRRYEPDGKLRNRKHPNAVLNGKETIQQVNDLVFRQYASSGEIRVPIQAQTICLHSDTKGMVNLAKVIYETLIGKGVIITAV